jgi:hypothetical protein
LEDSSTPLLEITMVEEGFDPDISWNIKKGNYLLCGFQKG